MEHKEIRPFPVPAFVVMRSTLFALAQMKAKLQAYNEESGVIVATMSKRLGLQKSEVIARIRSHQNSSQLELTTPNNKIAQELLNLIGEYMIDGGKVEANARIQWIDLARQEANRVRRQAFTDKAKALLPGNRPTPASQSAPVAPETEADESVVAEAGTALIPIPDNPGVLVKNEADKVVELKIDPQTFIDRTDHLLACKACFAANLQGNLYCANCGRPLTLEAVQPELRGGVEETAASSLRFALLALAMNVIPVLFWIMPAFFRSAELTFLNRVGIGLSTPIVIAALILGLLPMAFFAWRAIAFAQRAAWFHNLGATPDNAKRTRAIAGNALGYFDIYLIVAWVIFLIIAIV